MGFRVSGLSLGLRVWGLGFRVSGLGFRALGYDGLCYTTLNLRGLGFGFEYTIEVGTSTNRISVWPLYTIVFSITALNHYPTIPTPVLREGTVGSWGFGLGGVYRLPFRVWVLGGIGSLSVMVTV